MDIYTRRAAVVNSRSVSSVTVSRMASVTLFLRAQIRGLMVARSLPQLGWTAETANRSFSQPGGGTTHCVLTRPSIFVFF